MRNANNLKIFHSTSRVYFAKKWMRDENLFEFEIFRFHGLFNVISRNELKIQQLKKGFTRKLDSVNYAKTETFSAQLIIHANISHRRGLVSVCWLPFNHSQFKSSSQPFRLPFPRQSWGIMYLFACKNEQQREKNENVQSWKLFIYHFLLLLPFRSARSCYHCYQTLLF